MAPYKEVVNHEILRHGPGPLSHCAPRGDRNKSVNGGGKVRLKTRQTKPGTLPQHALGVNHLLEVEGEGPGQTQLGPWDLARLLAE